MNVNEFRQLLCRDLVTGVFERRGQAFLVTRFSYPGGDSVNIYLESRGNELRVTDHGTTQFVLATRGIDITDDRRDFIESVCVKYGMDFDGEALSKPIVAGKEGHGVLQFCEAITRVSTLAYDKIIRFQHGVKLIRQVQTLVTAKVLPVREYQPNWIDRSIDAEGLYPVDFHFNGHGAPKNLYVIGNARKAQDVVSTINYFARFHKQYDTLAVLGPAFKGGGKVGKRLRQAARLVEGVEGHEEEIVTFAKETASLRPQATLFETHP